MHDILSVSSFEGTAQFQLKYPPTSGHPEAPALVETLLTDPGLLNEEMAASASLLSKLRDEQIAAGVKLDQLCDLSVYEVALLRYYTYMDKHIDAEVHSQSPSAEAELLMEIIEGMLPRLPDHMQERWLEHNKDARLTLYHGSDKLDIPLDELKIGEKITYQHMFSATGQAHVAQDLSDCLDNQCEQKYVFVIRDSDATSVIYFSFIPSEDEYLMPRGTTFTVEHIDWRVFTADGKPFQDETNLMPLFWEKGVFLAEGLQPPKDLMFIPFITIRKAAGN